MKGRRLFDNYEEDGQLSLFSADYDDWDEDWEEVPEEDAQADADEEQSKQEKKQAPEAGKDVSAGKAVKAKSDASAKAKAKAGPRASDGASDQKTGGIGAAVDTYEKAVAGLEITNAGPTVRVKYCASCGKLLFVKEETAGFHSECNNCGIKYFQKL